MLTPVIDKLRTQIMMGACTIVSNYPLDAQRLDHSVRYKIQKLNNINLYLRKLPRSFWILLACYNEGFNLKLHRNIQKSIN